MTPQGEAYHIDWIWSNNSNVHVANHRDWFTTFTDFKTQITTALATGGTEVLGVGDVELNVKTSTTRKGSKSHRKVVLRDVLFAPKCICNILGNPILHEYNISYGGSERTGGLKDKKTGGSAGLFDIGRLAKLWLVGQQKGKSSLNPDRSYYINAMWSDTERAEWELCKKTSQLSLTSNTPIVAQPSINAGTAPYTTAEKAWLKLSFGGEFKFLISFGFDIHKDEDREAGRSVARGLIEADAAEDGQQQGLEDDDYEEHEGNEEEEEDEEEEEEENPFLADLEADPTSHFADRFFSEEQLAWVEKHWRHSGNFLLTYGLKFYDDDDCKEGVAIAQAMMDDEK